MASTRQMFLTRAFQKILSERESKKSQQAKLRSACETALDQLKAESKANEGHEGGRNGAAPYLEALQLACQSGVSKIMTTALDCLQKLIAYGYVGGGDDGTIEPVVETICNCFVGEATDEAVSLQILKGLLAGVSAAQSCIHKALLLQCVQTCYNIFLASRTPVTQATAKATLSQMLSSVFNRMEAVPLQTTFSVPATPKEQASFNGANGTTSAGQSNDSNSEEGNTNAASTGSQSEMPPQSPVQSPSDADGTPKQSRTTTDDIAQGEEGSTDPEQQKDLAEAQSNRFVDISHYDAFLVLRSLSKLSMKDLHDSTAQIDPRSHELRSKVLSLELLVEILQASGPVMHTHPEFIGVIKQYLCLSLSRNGVSTIPQVFELSLAVFLCLLSGFKLHLKSQIEIFLRDIFLAVLESPTSTIQQKMILLQALQRICSDPQLLVALYLNYDCDLDLDNIFTRLINDVSRIAQGCQASDLGTTPQQELAMRQKGLECLVTSLHAMERWMRTDELTLHSATSIGQGVIPGGANSSETAIPDVDNSNSDSTGTIAPVDDPSNFETRRKQKEVMEQGIALFNSKPKKGLAFLRERGMIGPTPQDSAHWLRTDDRLSKTMIGELLGENDKQSIEIMYAYVDGLEFKGMDFVDALRYFLAGFRLPGEAQKIDRLMEKFAEGYCTHNPAYQYFANADTAYVLAFSIIMLTTDLHSTSIKKKMTKDEFVRNNRGINDSKDLPREFLEGIFDEIERNEIKVKDTRPVSAKPGQISSAVLGDERLRRELYTQQMQVQVEAAQALLKEGGKRAREFVLPTRAEHAKPMFAIAWTPCLAAFSVGLQTNSVWSVVHMCLQGFKHAINLSASYYMATERDAFVSALAKFTSLMNGPAELGLKEVESLKTLLAAAQVSGNNMDKSWYIVLKCVSNFEVSTITTPKDKSSQNDSGSIEGEDSRKKSSQSVLSDHTGSLISSMAIPGSSSPSTNPKLSHDRYMSPTSARSKAREGRPASEGGDRERAQMLLVGVDGLFSGSMGLTGDAILHFVTALCAVSLEELMVAGNPRMYSLQKTVEISYYNMNRIRLEWARIWAVLGPYFNKVVTMSNTEVTLFSIDSLRQLATKFLERGELAHFHFQKDFLKPFEYAMTHNSSGDVRDMVVLCMMQMVKSQAANIRSGWKNIFYVFALASASPSESTFRMAYETTRDIIRTHKDLYPDTAFVDAVNCLVEFGCNPNHQTVSMEALEHIRGCAKDMHTRAQRDAEKGIVDPEGVWVRGWFPVLFGLHRVITRCNLDVRTRALMVLFEILKTYGNTFTLEHWQDLFRILFRLFDDQKMPEHPAEKAAWMNTTCNHALFAIGELFTQYYSTLAPLVPDFLHTLHWCVCQGNEQLARSATQCLQVLMLSNGKSFKDETWEASVKEIELMFQSSTPDEMFAFDVELQAQHDAQGVAKEAQRQGLQFHSIIIKCVVQLEMIQALENIVLQESAVTTLHDEERTDDQNGMYQYLGGEHMKVFLDCLRRSHDFARRFNTNHQLRTALWKAGFMKQLPNLLKQETTSLHASLGLLFRIYADPKRSDIWADVEQRLFTFNCEIMALFGQLTSDRQKEIWLPVLVLILKKVLGFDDERFKRHTRHYYNHLSDLLLLDLKHELRAVMHQMFRRIGQAFDIADNEPVGEHSARDAGQSDKGESKEEVTVEIGEESIIE